MGTLLIASIHFYSFFLSSELNENRGLKKLSEENLEVLFVISSFLLSLAILGPAQAGQEDQGDQGQAAGVQS